jgi:hypothetical protein
MLPGKGASAAGQATHSAEGDLNVKGGALAYPTE